VIPASRGTPGRQPAVRSRSLRRPVGQWGTGGAGVGCRRSGPALCLPAAGWALVPGRAWWPPCLHLLLLRALTSPPALGRPAFRRGCPQRGVSAVPRWRSPIPRPSPPLILFCPAPSVVLRRPCPPLPLRQPILVTCNALIRQAPAALRLRSRCPRRAARPVLPVSAARRFHSFHD
jgi:hypothetical protein